MLERDTLRKMIQEKEELSSQSAFVQIEARFENYTKRMEKLRESLQGEVKSLQDQHKKMVLENERLIDIINLFETTGREMRTTIEKSIALSTEALSHHTLEAMKIHVAKCLESEITAMQTKLSQGRKELIALVDEIERVQSSTKSRLSLLGSGFCIGILCVLMLFFLYEKLPWGAQSFRERRIGQYVQKALSQQPEEVQSRFWQGLERLAQLPA